MSGLLRNNVFSNFPRKAIDFSWDLSIFAWLYFGEKFQILKLINCSRFKASIIISLRTINIKINEPCMVTNKALIEAIVELMKRLVVKNDYQISVKGLLFILEKNCALL